MNSETPQPEQPAGTTVPAEASLSKGLVNPKLSGTLVADHAALENDLVQAQELAADFQRQLAGKSNEYAQLKQILAKTQTDLSHLQAGIEELRAERHRLANEAMRATAFEFKVEKITDDRDRLRVEMELLRMALEKKLDEQIVQLRERDRRIADLVIETVRLRQALADARANAAASPPSAAAEATEFDDVSELEVMREAPRPMRLRR